MSLGALDPPDDTVSRYLISDEGIRAGIIDTYTKIPKFGQVIDRSSWDTAEIQDTVCSAVDQARAAFAKNTDLWQIYDFRINFIGPAEQPTHLEFYFEGTLHHGAIAPFRVVIDLQNHWQYYVDYQAHFHQLEGQA